MAVRTFHLINNDIGPQTLKSRAGDIFRLEAFVFPKTGNVGGGTVALAINCTDSRSVNAPTTVTAISQAVPSTGAWTFLSGYATVPVGYDTVDPVLTLTSVPTTDFVYVDDALVREETIAYAGVNNAAGAQATAQSSVDAAVQALTGGSATGNTAGSMKSNMQAIPTACVAPTPNPSSSGIPVHGATATGITAGIDNTTTGSSLNTSTGSCTKAAADNFAGGWLLYSVTLTSSASTINDVDRGINYGSQFMSSLTGPIIIYQLGNTYWCLEYFTLVNPPSGAQNIQGFIDTIVGRILIGYTSGVFAAIDTFSGVLAVSYDAAQVTSGSSLSLTLPTAANYLAVAAFAAINYLGSEAISAFNKTQRSLAAPGTMASAGTALVVGDTPGLSGSQVFTATSSGGAYAAGGINLHGAGSTSIGSGFRVARTSTTAFNTPSTTTPAVLPASSFNATPDAITTADYTWVQSTNSVTVLNAGWYQVTLSVMTNGSYGSNQMLGLELFKNAANIRHGLRFNQGGFANILQSTWVIYCNANDVLQPGAYAGFGSAIAGFVGEASGIGTFFELCPSNRSLL